MKNIFNNFLNIISNTLFPIKCILCKEDNLYLCLDCENKLPILGHEQKLSDWIFCKYKYQNYNIKKIEHAIKYKHHPKLGEVMGKYSYNFILNNIINRVNYEIKIISAAGGASSENKEINIYLVPIPISKERLKQRGYNQTEYIAEGILKEAENKMNPNFKILNILERKETIKLKDIYGVDNRAEEIRDSMSIDVFKIEDFLRENKININNLKSQENIYVLIDDITTTGSTFYEARRALTDYGIISKNIYAFALAH